MNIDTRIETLTGKRTITFHGQEFTIICNPVEWHPSWWSFMDEVETRNLWWNIKPGDIVFDIGADYGSYTLTALATGAARVYAWSPPFKAAAPHEAYTIKLSAWENGWEDRLVVFDDGLWSHRGYIASMDGPRAPRVFATRKEALNAIHKQPGFCSVFPVRTLDEAVKLCDVSRIDWMKLDTEACEIEILNGGLETIKRFRPNLFVENHVCWNPTIKDDFWKIIDGLGLGYVEIGTRQHATVSHSLYVIP